MNISIQLFINIIIISYIESIYQSTVIFSSLGSEFQSENNLDLFLSKTVSKRILCIALCNQHRLCYTFDFDFISGRCRLFESNLRTGSIIVSSSSSSIVGIIKLTSNLYQSIHDQSCQICEHNRYEICSSIKNTCQCPLHTFWNGSICLLQLYENRTCLQIDGCRKDFNLTCSMDVYGKFLQCSTVSPSALPFGVTVVGLYNGTSNDNDTILSGPRGIAFSNNGSLYVTDATYKVIRFPQNSRIGQTVMTYLSNPAMITFDQTLSNFYVSIPYNALVQMWPSNNTIPPNPGTASCTTDLLYFTIGVAVDSLGNVYIASTLCNWVTKWSLNATNGTLVAGLSTANAGNDNWSLNWPFGLFLDELNENLYIADYSNHRVQKVILNGSGYGVTVAGGNGAGVAANQLNSPTSIIASRYDGAIYIADRNNNRIQKWLVNATFGITIADSPSGIAGNTPYLLNWPFDIKLACNEECLYVSDNRNNRIQRFYLQ
ncbi:hypothetical protein I4U23_031440 [Adineta vaga]|nr:hypothetical protein I4U23_031440 [Adineta vaga]